MIDFLIINAYCALCLYIGLFTVKNIKSIKDFATSHRNYSTFVIISTVAATLIGGGTTFGLAGEVFSQGISYSFIISGAALNQFLIALFIAPRLDPIRNCISVGEMMGKKYGKIGQVVTGIATTRISTGMVGAQVIAIGYIFHYFTGMSQLTGILIGCSVLIIYSGFGGMRSVITTDLVQFITLIIGIPLLCFVGLKAVGGFSALSAALPKSHLSIFVGSGQKASAIATFLTFCTVGAFYPSFIQRQLITRNKKQAIRVATLNGFMSIPFYFIVGIIGLIAFTLDSTQSSNMALPYLVKTILPVGLRGFVIAGLLAIMMSTADSELNIAAVAIVNDVLRPLKLIKEKYELKYAQIFTFILGISTIVLALNFNRVIDIMLYAFNFWGPIIFIPLVAAILGYIISVRGFLISAAVGILTLFIWNTLLKGSIGFDGFMPSVAANLISFISFYFSGKRVSVFTNTQMTKST